MNAIHVQAVPDYDVVPGTVYIIDSAGSAHYSKHDILLVPEPSGDLNDPLRWGRWRKSYHLFLLFCYSTILGAITNWSSTIYVVLAQVYQTTIAKLSIGLALCLLMLGVMNVFFIPLSNKFGRRALYISSLLLVIAAEIWLANSKTVGDFHGAHVLLGIGAAPFEAMVPISISDIYFAHERVTKLSFYVFGLAFGSFVGPICVGYMVTSQGWRWVYWWGTILTGILWLLFFFTFEESRFDRPAALHEGARDIHVVGKDVENTSTHNEKSATADGGPLHYTTTGPRVGEILETGRFRIQYGLFKSFPVPWSVVLKGFYQPLKVSSLPAVIWCGINYGTCVSWLAVMGTTVAATLAPPPYLFTNSQIGLFWIAPLIGSVVGATYAGPLNDRFVLWMSNRNRGFREPEFRLWSFIPTAFIMPAGLLLYGISSAHGMKWIVPFVGAALVGFGLSVGGTISTGYILDCYKEIDTQVITTIILIRNLVGFAITWAIQPWITNMGKQNAFITVGVLAFVITGGAVIFIALGKRMRKWTARRYDSLARQM